MMPAVGASTCASGSQVWNGNMGTLIAKARKKATNTQRCSTCEAADISSGMASMSKVPVWRRIARIATSISTLPAKV